MVPPMTLRKGPKENKDNVEVVWFGYTPGRDSGGDSAQTEEFGYTLREDSVESILPPVFWP